jgi:hypothetical protein
LTTISARGSASVVSSSISVAWSESMEWVDMLGNSFLSRPHALRARLDLDTRRGALHD